MYKCIERHRNLPSRRPCLRRRLRLRLRVDCIALNHSHSHQLQCVCHHSSRVPVHVNELLLDAVSERTETDGCSAGGDLRSEPQRGEAHAIAQPEPEPETHSRAELSTTSSCRTRIGSQRCRRCRNRSYSINPPLSVDEAGAHRVRTSAVQCNSERNEHHIHN